MSYIGIQSQNQISPQFSREVINGDGSATSFTLIQDVPGFNADNIMVVVNNVIQEPVAAYTITEDANGNPRVLDFGSGNVLSTTDDCYVQHRGVGTLNMTPAAGSVNAAALQDNLKSGNVDSYTANAGDTNFTLTETPLNVNTITVFVNGIYQKPTTNYSVSGTTLTLTAGAVAGDEVDVIHNTLRTTVTHVADQSVTTGKIANDAVTGAKIENNPTIAGNLTVSGTSTLTGAATLSSTAAITGNTTVGGTLGVTGNITASANLTVNGNTTLGNATSDTVTIAGNLTVNGTQTTINSTTLTVDDKNIEIASVDSPSDTTATGAGITVKGGTIQSTYHNSTDKLFQWQGGSTSQLAFSSSHKIVENKGSSALQRPLTTSLVLG